MNVSQRGGRRGLWLLAAAAVLAAGCVPPTRVEFIEKLSKENRKIARSTRDFRKALLPLSSVPVQSADSSQVHSAYDAMRKAVGEVKGDMAHQMLPPSSSAAKPFLQAYKDYLEEEQTILDGTMKQIVDTVDDSSLGDDQKGQIIWGTDANQHRDGLIARAAQEDGAAFSKLSDAQRSYTSEHNYDPQTLETYQNNVKAGK